VGSAGELIARVRQLDPSAAKLLAESAQAFLPILLVNRVSTVAERSAGQRLVARCREHLGAPIELAGCIESDPNVPAAVARRQAVFQAFPHCAFSRSVASLTEHLLRDEWDASREQAPNRGRSRSQQRPTRSLPTLDPAQPGAYLRRCRETLGLSLRELTERTCIRVLDHIEAEHFAQLPPEPYLRGYLLSYGQELGVPDLPRLVACYLGRDRDANA
jgi:hypothetical protein